VNPVKGIGGDRGNLAARAAGICVLALLALVAFGTASASATKLCKAAETPECLVAKTYGIGTKFQLDVVNESSVRFVLSSGDLTCKESKFELLLAEAGTPLKTKISSMVFSSCVQGKTTCAVETRNQPLLANIYKFSELAYYGRVDFVPREGANPSWKLSCTGGLDCIYGSKAIEGAVISGLTPLFKIEEKPLELEQGAGCPKETKIVVGYDFDVSPIYVTG